jgi:hypothetical protein
MSQTRPRYGGLIWPFAIFFAGVVAASLYWFWGADQIQKRLTSLCGGPARCRVGPVSGYPFRFYIELRDLTAAKGGWAFAAPEIQGEAFAFAPEHWVFVITRGLSISRPGGGRIDIGAQVIRASLSEPRARPPRISVEALGVTLSSPAGAKPFFLTAAKEIHLHAKSGPSDQGAFLIEIDGGAARPGSVVGDWAAGGPVNLTLNGVFSHASALKGDPGSALEAWRLAGGAWKPAQAEIKAGAADLSLQPGATLGITPDHRLQGQASLAMTNPDAIARVLAAHKLLTPEGARAAASQAGRPRIVLPVLMAGGDIYVAAVRAARAPKVDSDAPGPS